MDEFLCRRKSFAPRSHTTSKVAEWQVNLTQPSTEFHLRSVICIIDATLGTGRESLGITRGHSGIAAMRSADDSFLKNFRRLGRTGSTRRFDANQTFKSASLGLWCNLNRGSATRNQRAKGTSFAENLMDSGVPIHSG